MVTVKAQEGKTYADLLKKVKEQVDIKEIGVTIKNARKSGKGDLLLTVEGGNDKATILQQAIKTKMKDVEVNKRRTANTIYISGIDATTTEDEIVGALTATSKVQCDQVKVVSLRTGRNEECTAVVELPKDIAADMIGKGKIEIGWSICRVRERIFIARCFKCLDFGHKTRDCSSQVNRTDECLNCGKMGHKAKECKSPAYCTTCNKTGHRADQTRCPVFSGLVNDARRSRRQKAANKLVEVPPALRIQ